VQKKPTNQGRKKGNNIGAQEEEHLSKREVCTCCGVWPSASARAGRESVALALGRTYGDVTARHAVGCDDSAAEAARMTRRASAASMLFFFPIAAAVEREEARAEEWRGTMCRWMDHGLEHEDI
jgi:hypothetical protein